MRFSVPILQTQDVERFGENTLIYSEYKPWACEDLCIASSHAFLFLNYTVFPLRSFWRRQYPNDFLEPAEAMQVVQQNEFSLTW